MKHRRPRKGEWFVEYGFHKKAFRVQSVYGTKVKIQRADGSEGVIKTSRLTSLRYYKALY